MTRMYSTVFSTHTQLFGLIISDPDLLPRGSGLFTGRSQYFNKIPTTLVF